MTYNISTLYDRFDLIFRSSLRSRRVLSSPSFSFLVQMGHGKRNEMSRKQRKERKNRAKKLKGTAKATAGQAAKKA